MKPIGATAYLTHAKKQNLEFIQFFPADHFNLKVPNFENWISFPLYKINVKVFLEKNIRQHLCCNLELRATYSITLALTPSPQKKFSKSPWEFPSKVTLCENETRDFSSAWHLSRLFLPSIFYSGEMKLGRVYEKGGCHRQSFAHNFDMILPWWHITSIARVKSRMGTSYRLSLPFHRHMRVDFWNVVGPQFSQVISFAEWFTEIYFCWIGKYGAFLIGLIKWLISR